MSRNSNQADKSLRTAYRPDGGADEGGDVRDIAGSPSPRRDGAPRLAIGEAVEWTNGSYLVDTGGRGEIVHLSGDHAVIFNADVARRHPQLSPYVVKPLSDLRPARAALAA